MICGQNIGSEPDILTAFLMQKHPNKTADTLIFKAVCATLLHRYTSKCVMRYKIMAERNMVNLTITMTKEERKALKQIALNKDMTVSALIRMWLQEQQEVEVKE